MLLPFSLPILDGFGMAFPLATGDMGSNGGLFGKLEGVAGLLNVDEDMIHSGSVLLYGNKAPGRRGNANHYLPLYMRYVTYTSILFYFFFAPKERYLMHKNA